MDFTAKNEKEKEKKYFIVVKIKHQKCVFFFYSRGRCLSLWLPVVNSVDKRMFEGMEVSGCQKFKIAVNSFDTRLHSLLDGRGNAAKQL